MLSRTAVFLYGVISYLVFFFTFLYAIGFVGNFIVPKSIDTPAAVPVGTAVAIDLILLGLFAVQHSVMARPGFKEWWTRFIPRPIERSTYVLLASLILLLIFWKWQPLTGRAWDIDNPIAAALLQALFWIGWLTVLFSTFLINHFDLFGLRQVYLHQRGLDYSFPEFHKRLLYKIVRHPIMLGFIIAFWATPHMSLGHLLSAFGTTAYILIALQLEERDLVNIHGESYKEYQREVAMLIPVPKRRRS